MLSRRNVAQIRLGSRNGKTAKTPLGENKEGNVLAGFAKDPPIAGPIIVPIDQTKGMTANAFAVKVSRATRMSIWGIEAYVHVRAF